MTLQLEQSDSSARNSISHHHRQCTLNGNRLPLLTSARFPPRRLLPLLVFYFIDIIPTTAALTTIPTTTANHHISNNNNTYSNNIMLIRPPTSKDIPSIRAIIEANQLFPPEMIDDMIQPFLLDNTTDPTTNNNNNRRECWFIEEEEGVEEQQEHNDDEVEEDDSRSRSISPPPLVRAVVYCGPEKMTESTYNAWLLAVHPSAHRQGCGRRLMAHLEGYLLTTASTTSRPTPPNVDDPSLPPQPQPQCSRNSNNVVVVLLVETAGTDDYKIARSFYESVGFVEEARIRDFYSPGEDKVVYWKRLL